MQIIELSGVEIKRKQGTYSKLSIWPGLLIELLDDDLQESRWREIKIHPVICNFEGFIVTQHFSLKFHII